MHTQHTFAHFPSSQSRDSFPSETSHVPPQEATRRVKQVSALCGPPPLFKKKKKSTKKQAVTSPGACNIHTVTWQMEKCKKAAWTVGVFLFFLIHTAVQALKA